MTTTMKAFLEKLSANKELAIKASKLDKSGLITLAKELGIELTEADFTAPDGEISESELEAIAGGSTCKCYIAGGGTKTSGEDAACGCVAYGQGNTASNSPCVDFRDVIRCQCIHSGEGDTLQELVADSHSSGHRNH